MIHGQLMKKEREKRHLTQETLTKAQGVCCQV